MYTTITNNIIRWNPRIRPLRCCTDFVSQVHPRLAELIAHGLYILCHIARKEREFTPKLICQIFDFFYIDTLLPVWRLKKLEKILIAQGDEVFLTFFDELREICISLFLTSKISRNTETWNTNLSVPLPGVNDWKSIRYLFINLIQFKLIQNTVYFEEFTLSFWST